jgi:multimeric flavodoxin WrbA
MKILALIGSPRKGGNTDTLVNQILKGSRKSGHTGDKIYLYEYKISPCIDCLKCKKGKLVCPINDGMKKIYPKMERADLIVFGTPIYWYGPTGPMKLLIDRMRPFAANKKLRGKKWIMVAPAQEGARACKPLVEMFSLSFDYLGMKYVDKLLATANERGEVKGNRKLMDRAFRLGTSL